MDSADSTKKDAHEKEIRQETNPSIQNNIKLDYGITLGEERIVDFVTEKRQDPDAIDPYYGNPPFRENDCAV